MKKTLKKIWQALCSPFVALACVIDESRRINDDGSWDTYWEKANKKKGDRKI